MDINTTALSTASIKTPDAESENPIRIQPPTKPLPLTNGVLKRHHPLHHHRSSPQSPVSYKECLKNHAAIMGGHALDGCGEFMPSPNTNPNDPTSLKCAACGCHRNFHRRDPEDNPHTPQSAPSAVIEYQPHHRHHPLPPPRGGACSTPNSPSPPPISSSYYPSAPHMLLALSAGIPPDNNQAIGGNTAGAVSPGMGHPNGRKRFRTKFSQEQKEKMHEFAERVEWKMQKRDEETIAEFCSQIGVDRGVLKVWMHNNKSTLGKKEANNNTNGTSNTTNSTTATPTTTQYHIQINNTNNDIENRNTLNLPHQFHNNDSTISGPVVATNGSSSSS